MKGTGFIRLTIISRTTGEVKGEVAYVPWKEIIRITPGPHFRGLDKQNPISSTLRYRDNSEDFVRETPFEILSTIREDIG